MAGFRPLNALRILRDLGLPKTPLFIDDARLISDVAAIQKKRTTVAQRKAGLRTLMTRENFSQLESIAEKVFNAGTNVPDPKVVSAGAVGYNPLTAALSFLESQFPQGLKDVLLRPSVYTPQGAVFLPPGRLWENNRILQGLNQPTIDLNLLTSPILKLTSRKISNRSYPLTHPRLNYMRPASIRSLVQSIGHEGQHRYEYGQGVLSSLTSEEKAFLKALSPSQRQSYYASQIPHEKRANDRGRALLQILERSAEKYGWFDPKIVIPLMAALGIGATGASNSSSS